MAYHFSANQFEDQYSAKRLGNWEYPKWYRERPKQRFEKTKIIADDKGRLLEGIKRQNPWGNFVNTWDLPRRITRDYVNKLIGPTPGVSKPREKKNVKPEPEIKDEVSLEKETKPVGELCKICNRLLVDCSCGKLLETKSSHSSQEGIEKCDDPLYCVKCNQELCMCEDKCRCSSNV